MSKIDIAIFGATGYTGEELVRILCNHPNVNIKYLISQSNEGEKYENIYRNFKNLNVGSCINAEIEEIASNVDLIFLALPHGISSGQITKDILQKTKIIDLSADFRLKNKDVYEKWYCKHNSPELLKDAIYGLSEIYRDKIKNAKLVANAGCYTTCSILTLYPLVKNDLIDLNTIIIDAKSGVSGSGKKATSSNLFCEANENIKAYNILKHRHKPEIEQELSFACGENIKLQFTPHLIPVNRGILATCYAKLKSGVSKEDVKNAYQEQYKNEFFVRLLDEGVFPETKYVKGSNFIDINYQIDEETGNIIAIGAIDNLVKGASGQAVQNMNIMFGFEEKTALCGVGMFF